MKKYLFILITITLAVNGFAQTATAVLPYNEQRLAMQQEAQTAQQKQLRSEQMKSPAKAALFSAILPGAGEAYAGSYWKAAAFIAAEATLWTFNIIYDQKGKDEDKRMRTFAKNHWSEQRYWSSVYYFAEKNDKWTGQELQWEADNLISQADIDANIELLRTMENEINYTHTLPETHTQQYYEMIYKYVSQFGNGWDDVTETLGDPFYYTVNGDLSATTPNQLKYRKMRNREEDFYVVATTMARLAMLNHLVSMFDAAITVRGMNKKIQYGLRVEPHYDGYTYNNLYGVHIVW